MTDGHDWHEHRLPLADHEMAWYDCGAGTAVLLIHGSYDHLLYRPMAELFAHKYRMVCYDQRGSGGSTLPSRDDRLLHVDKFVADIDALRDHLGLERWAVVGHSWGATLGLLYAGRFPERIERLALIGMGPVDEEMHAVYRANVLRMMHPDARARWPDVHRAYVEAWLSGRGVDPELDEENIRAWAPVMFYGSDSAEAFVGEYLRAGGWRRHGPPASGLARRACLADAHRIAAPVLILYGYQDYEPITQAYLLAERIPGARVCFLNECGHTVWRDQPERLFRAVDSFLTGREEADP